MKKALITGSLGQDGSYLAEHLLKMGYEVWGTCRGRLYDVPRVYAVKGVHYAYADLRDALSLETLIRKVYPDEIYNLAGQVFVPTSWESPVETFDVNTAGFVRILQLVDKLCPTARVYQASSSEMYGNVLGFNSGYVLLNEESPMNPVSPYAVSKYASHRLVDVYRKKGLYVVSGILFNHESPRRGPEMVTRKITRGLIGAQQLRLGNPDSQRDWGFAGDYVKAMHLMMQQKDPEDFVIGTGVAHSVKEFVDWALHIAGMNGEGRQGIEVIYNCPEFTRKNELHTLIADYSKARNKLGWEPQTSFEQLVEMMVKGDTNEYIKMRETYA